MSNRSFIAWAAFFGMTGVILGALGAHALEAKLEPDSLDSFKTAVRYQVWHALALFALGTVTLPLKFQKAIGILWILGVILFSGSIFLLSTSALLSVSFTFLGPVTPIGGLLMITGWFLLLLSAFRKGYTKKDSGQKI